METTTLRLFILFEDGFWVGYFERACGGEYRAARHVFGSDPGLAELRDFVLSRDSDRIRWTRSHTFAIEVALGKNPKRRMREIAKSMHDSRVASKARQAIKAEQEARQVERRSSRSAANAELKDERYFEKRELRKRKRRGH